MKINEASSLAQVLPLTSEILIRNLWNKSIFGIIIIIIILTLPENEGENFWQYAPMILFVMSEISQFLSLH